MSQKRNRKPALALKVDCIFVAAVKSKKNRRKRMQASLPRFSPVFFFCVLRTLAEQALRTAALVSCALVSPFLLRQKRAGFALRRGRGNAVAAATPHPLVSPQRNGGPPRTQPLKLAAGPDGCAVRSARSAQKKRAEAIGASLLASVESTLFFIQSAETSQPKAGFRVGFREGLWPSKAASLTSPSVTSLPRQTAP